MSTANNFLGKIVKIKVDRPLGSKHPKHSFIYPVNYGYVPNTISGDGEELDAYILGTFEPLDEFTGKCIAIIHRTNDDDDKLIVVPEDKTYSDAEIMALTEFQERFFTSIIIREDNILKESNVSFHPSLYILTGPPGVGKTTISNELAQSLDKSVVIEGDDIYNQVVSSHVSPWKEGNHLNIFWEICLNTIDIYIKNNYNVVFNYIISPKDLNILKTKFKNYTLRFSVLLANKETLLARDSKRPLDCQMHERCVILLEKFQTQYVSSNNIINTTNASVKDIINTLKTDDKFII